MINNPFSDACFDPPPQRKLPRIGGMVLKSGKTHQSKSSAKLPMIKAEPNKNLESLAIINTTRERQKSEGDDFMGDIEKKLRTVLEEQSVLPFEDASDSDEDF